MNENFLEISLVKYMDDIMDDPQNEKLYIQLLSYSKFTNGKVFHFWRIAIIISGLHFILIIVRCSDSPCTFSDANSPQCW